MRGEGNVLQDANEVVSLEALDPEPHALELHGEVGLPVRSIRLPPIADRVGLIEDLEEEPHGRADADPRELLGGRKPEGVGMFPVPSLRVVRVPAAAPEVSVPRMPTRPLSPDFRGRAYPS